MHKPRSIRVALEVAAATYGLHETGLWGGSGKPIDKIQPARRLACHLATEYAHHPIEEVAWALRISNELAEGLRDESVIGVANDEAWEAVVGRAATQTLDALHGDHPSWHGQQVPA